MVLGRPVGTSDQLVTHLRELSQPAFKVLSGSPPGAAVLSMGPLRWARSRRLVSPCEPRRSRS